MFVFFQAEDGIRDAHEGLEFRRVLFRSVTDDWNECGTSNVYIVTVGTPLSKEGTTDLSSIKAVAEQIGKYLKENDLVILRSTVRIGVSQKIVKSTQIGRASGRAGVCQYE